jgi:aminomethyltransferase
MPLRTPPLREVHAERGAKFTEFGGWDMPVEFDSIRTEHAAVREAAGLFDVSHMGEIAVSGPDAMELVNRLTTNDVAALEPGDAQYAMITDETGVVLDDTVVYRLPASRDSDYLFVPNAGHDAEMHERWTGFRDQWGLDATVANVTTDYGLLALQGPDAEDLLAAETDDPQRVRELSSFGTTDATVAGVDVLVSRTGYTGEDGFELFCPWADTGTVWSALDCQPCGLGARDTLRIEMGFLLSGQDFDPEDDPRTPYEAGVGFTVDLDTDFVGRDALVRVAERGVEERFVGFTLLERGVPRHGYDVTDTEGLVIGRVTSGTMSPTLGEPIGLGYLPTEYADPGTTVRVVVRGQQKAARVQTTPFIDR